jgi:hypothetical protein
MNRNLVWALLLCSVAANIGFAFALRSRANSADRSHVSNAPPADENAGAHRVVAPAIAPSTSTAGKPHFAFDPAHPEALAAGLRAAGFPEPVVREIVHTAVAEHLSARRDALLARIPVPMFWESQRTPPEIEAALSDLRREQADLVRAALLAGPLPDDERRPRCARYGDLADEKLLGLERIELEYAELSQRTRQEMRGEMSYSRELAWERAQLDYIEAEKRRDIEALLSPAELEAYDLRASRTATSLRPYLGLFGPSEQEYRALYELFRPMLEQPGANLAITSVQRRATLTVQVPDGSRPPDEAATATNEQLRAVLGEARFADLQRSIDFGYRTAYELTLRYGLPTENARGVYDLQRSASTRQNEILRDPNLGSAEKRAALETLARETGTRVVQFLGEAGSAPYRQRSGSWLTNLENAPRQVGPGN